MNNIYQNINIKVREAELIACQEGYLIWPKHQTLVVADLHMTKIGHFRKNGYALPQGIMQQELEIIQQAIDVHDIKTILVLGDMFHSAANKELQLFEHWRNKNHTIRIILVKGNHDVLPKVWYNSIQIDLVSILQLEEMVFVHDLNDYESFTPLGFQSNKMSLYKLAYHEPYVLCGHIHPAVAISGKARERLVFDCFYFGESIGILPAFSKFLGNCVLKPLKKDKIFALTPNGLISL